MDKIDQLSGDWTNRLATSEEVATLKTSIAFIKHVLQDSEPLKTPDNSDQPSGKAIGPGKPKKNGRKKSHGGQKHKGANHRREPNPEVVVVLDSPERDNDPDWVRDGTKWGQTLDIELRRNVTEHQSIVYKHLLTGEIWFRELPEGRCGTVRVGTELKTLVVLLRDAGHLSYERIKLFIGESTNLWLNEATLVKIVKEAESSPLLHDFVDCADRALLASPVVHHDETGISVDGHNEWDHVRASLEFTIHNLHKKRGKEAMDAIGFLPNYKGTVIHDCFAPYFPYDNFEHGLCNAHLLRELECAMDMDQEWAESMSDLLSELNKQTNLHGGALSEKQQEKARKAYSDIIDWGYEATGGREFARPAWQIGRRGRTAKPKYRNLLERMDKRRDPVLLFIKNPLVPFTNNLVERCVRPVKLHLKVAGCFRKKHMARGFLRMRGYMDSCGKNGINGFQAIKMLLTGELPEFIRKWGLDRLQSAA
jgi:transposase